MELYLKYFFNPFQPANRDYENEFKKCLSLINKFELYYTKNKIFYNN